MQWRMLRRRGPQASWTLVGDPAQSSYPSDDETRRAMRDLIGRGASRTFRLSTNYRSPAEIMDLAGRVITSVYPDADVPASVRRTGVQPELLALPDAPRGERLGRVLTRLAAEVDGSIAVICAAGRLASVRDTIASMPLPDELRNRLTVLTALQVKGLEFDATIVLAPDEIVQQTAGGVRVLYVALTRATQRLVTLDLTDGRPGAWRESLELPANGSE